MVETMTLAKKPKKRNTRWAPVPHLAPIISKNVCALGAFILRFEARIAKSRI